MQIRQKKTKLLQSPIILNIMKTNWEKKKKQKNKIMEVRNLVERKREKMLVHWNSHMHITPFIPEQHCWLLQLLPLWPGTKWTVYRVTPQSWHGHNLVAADPTLGDSISMPHLLHIITIPEKWAITVLSMQLLCGWGHIEGPDLHLN